MREKKTDFLNLKKNRFFTSCINKHETFISNWAAPGKPCIGVNEPINECGSDTSNICV